MSDHPPQRIQLQAPGQGSTTDAPLLFRAIFGVIDLVVTVGVGGGVWYATGSILYGIGAGVAAMVITTLVGLSIVGE